MCAALVACASANKSVHPSRLPAIQLAAPSVMEAGVAVLSFRFAVLEDTTAVDACSVQHLLGDSAAVDSVRRSLGAPGRLIRGVSGSRCSPSGIATGSQLRHIELTGFRASAMGAPVVDATWMDGEYSHREEYTLAGGPPWRVASFRQYDFLQGLLAPPPPPKPLQHDLRVIHASLTL